MITGNQGARHKVYAESLGVDVYLNKPFRMEKLLDAGQETPGPPRRTDTPDHDVRISDCHNVSYDPLAFVGRFIALASL